MARAVPFHKRFPGRHAVSALVVLPSGARIEIAGPFDAATAELVRDLLCGNTTGLAVQAAMSTLKFELEAASRQAVTASEKEADRG